MELFWIVGLLAGCEEAIVVPPVPADPSPTTGYTPPCCAISDGPWGVEGGSLDTNGDFQSTGAIGKIWAYDPTTDLDNDPNTKDWYEYAERMNTVWYWPSSGKPWRVHVEPLTTSQLPEKCLESGYQKCQEYQAFTSTLSDPAAELMPARPLGQKRILLADYFAEGKYRVRAYFAGTPTPQTAWFITKGSLGTRQEVFCIGSGFSWPRRTTPGKAAVDWVIDYNGAAPATLPANPTDCGNLPDGTATSALRSDAIKLY